MAAVFGLAVLAAGCAFRPPESRISKVSAGVPERWIASKAARAGIDQDWIKRFGDPQLVALVDESMKNNPDLRVAAERIRRAEAVARLSGAARRVQVSGQITGQLQKQRFPGFPLKLGSNTAEVYGASLDVNWELDLWGRLRATQRAEIADQEAQEQDYRAARVSMAAPLAKAWFALGEANEQIGLAQGAILVRDKTARSIRERFAGALEGGLASQLRLAETDLAGSRAALARW